MTRRAHRLLRQTAMNRKALDAATGEDVRDYAGTEYTEEILAADGRQISESALPAMPVFDGLSAANGRLYLSTLDGKVRCLSGAAK